MKSECHQTDSLIYDAFNHQNYHQPIQHLSNTTQGYTTRVLSTIYKSTTWKFSPHVEISAAPAAHPTSSLETNLHSLTAMNLQPRHNLPPPHYENSTESNSLHQVHTRVHSLTCFTHSVVTDRGFIHITAIKLYLLHYLYNTCFTQNIVTHRSYICTTVFSSI